MQHTLRCPTPILKRNNATTHTRLFPLRASDRASGICCRLLPPPPPHSRFSIFPSLLRPPGPPPSPALKLYTDRRWFRSSFMRSSSSSSPLLHLSRIFPLFTQSWPSSPSEGGGTERVFFFSSPAPPTDQNRGRRGRSVPKRTSPPPHRRRRK